jgi:hypothetical protein
MSELKLRPPKNRSVSATCKAGRVSEVAAAYVEFGYSEEKSKEEAEQ